MSTQVSAETIHQMKLEELPSPSPPKQECIVCLVRKVNNENEIESFYKCEKEHLFCDACTWIPGYGRPPSGYVIKFEYCPSCNPMIKNLKRRERAKELVQTMESRKFGLELAAKRVKFDLEQTNTRLGKLKALIDDEKK